MYFLNKKYFRLMPVTILNGTLMIKFGKKLSIFGVIEVVPMSTHFLCFEQKYEKFQNCLSENFQFLEVKFSIY